MGLRRSGSGQARRDRQGLTVYCLALFLIDAVILGDEEVESVVWAGNGPDLVFLVEVVAGIELVKVPRLAVSGLAIFYPKPSRSAGNSGSLGSVWLRRRNILLLACRMVLWWNKVPVSGKAKT